MNDKRYFISASRRTDIPAFQADWLMQNIRKGSLTYPKPYSGQFTTISLKPDKIAGIIFWSKNYTPFIQYLRELQTIYDNRLFFHFTITGYSVGTMKVLEPSVPDVIDAIACIKKLGRYISPHQIAWRFDPIIFSDITPPEKIIQNFSFILSEIHKNVGRIFISLVDLYGKVSKRFENISLSYGIRFYSPSNEQIDECIGKIKEIAESYGKEIYSCCEPQLTNVGLKQGHCVDTPLLIRLFGLNDIEAVLKPTRKDCGCYASVDIGTYRTCQHGCVYCYAN